MKCKTWTGDRWIEYDVDDKVFTKTVKSPEKIDNTPRKTELTQTKEEMMHKLAEKWNKSGLLDGKLDYSGMTNKLTEMREEWLKKDEHICYPLVKRMYYQMLLLNLRAGWTTIDIINPDTYPKEDGLDCIIYGDCGKFYKCIWYNDLNKRTYGWELAEKWKPMNWSIGGLCGKTYEDLKDYLDAESKEFFSRI
jgi:hypothetical protein